MFSKSCIGPKIDDVEIIHRKGKNRVRIVFHNYISANAFLDRLDRFQYFHNIFISSKEIIRNVDTWFADEELLKLMLANMRECDILKISR